MTERSPAVPQNLAARTRGRMSQADLRRVLDTSLLSTGRLSGMVSAIDMAADVPGDTAEIGTAHGGTSRLIALLNGGRQHWACDTFEGLLDCGEHDVLTNGQFHNPADKVRAVLGDLRNVSMVAGYFPKSATYAMKRATFSLVHIDVDTYASIKACFAWFAQRMAPGAVMVLDDVLAPRGCPGAIKAFEEIRESCDGSWSVIQVDAPPQAVLKFR